MSDLTPPPEHDLSLQRRQAIRAALQDAQPGRRRTPILAAAAVAAIVAAGIAIPQLRSDDRPKPAGGPDPSVLTVATAAPRSPKVVPSRTPTLPSQPAKEPEQICRETIARQAGASGGAVPGRDAPAVVRATGRTGTAMIIADETNWIGCDTARYAEGGNGSLLRPRRITPPPVGDADAFAVSGLVFTDNGPMYDYYFAAGVLPRGVTGVSYTFPDGVTRPATIAGRFWLMRYEESKPRPPTESDLDQERIKVTLYGAGGSVVRIHRLAWGEQTCAHINHGC
jgi:hypothetical protein